MDVQQIWICSYQKGSWPLDKLSNRRSSWHRLAQYKHNILPLFQTLSYNIRSETCVTYFHPMHPILLTRALVPVWEIYFFCLHLIRRRSHHSTGPSMSNIVSMLTVTARVIAETPPTLRGWCDPSVQPWPQNCRWRRSMIFHTLSIWFI